MTSQDQDPTARLIQAEIEVPATPEEVWEAIATGPGNAAWLFPAEIEPGKGGTMTIHRAPYGGDAEATVTAWDPPRRFAYEEPMQGPDGSPAEPWATEFLVEARAGGTCVVRVVTGVHHHGEDWEDMVEGAGEGWRGALVSLRGYLAHFAGQPAARLDATDNTGRPLEDRAQVSARLLGALGLAGLSAGDTFRASSEAPPLAGVVEGGVLGDVGGDDQVHGLMLRTEDPGPGLFEVSTFSMDGVTVTVNISARLYGPEAKAIADREQPRWNAWLAAHLPAFAASP